MQPNTTVTLRFVEGSSDKQYSVTIQPSGDSFDVVAAWGRTGSTMQTAVKTATPVPLEKAQALANKLLDEKRRKGYTDAAGGAAYSGVEFAGRDSGFRVQLLEPVAEGQTERLLTDPDWVMQEKYDGERRLIVLCPGETPVGVNRNGLEVAINGDLASVLAERIQVQVTGKTVLDGEDFGSTFAPFDLLVLNDRDLRDLPYSERVELLEGLIAEAPEVPRLQTYRTTEQKRAAYARLREQGFEGVVFKLLSAIYTAGRAGKDSTQFKDKFVESATCRVIDRNGDKRSVALELMDDATGLWHAMGSCTIPANFSIPDRGALVEIGYLYARKGGALFQPTYKGVRRDLDPSACVISQLKFKQEQAHSQAA
jgi:bifunctional non-homologous end joining protein LigD